MRAIKVPALWFTFENKLIMEKISVNKNRKAQRILPIWKMLKFSISTP